MSQETKCFSASIYLDGKKVGLVRNHGCGGSHLYSWYYHEAAKHITAYVEAMEFEFHFEKLDQFIDKLCLKTEVFKDITKRCKKETLFFLSTDKAGEWRTVNRPYSQKIKELILSKCPEILIIANEDIAKAVDFEFRQHYDTVTGVWKWNEKPEAEVENWELNKDTK